MATPPEVRITVDADGNVTIDAIGYEGPACEQATRALEEALGTVQKKVRKPEYQQRVQAKREQRS